MKRNLKASPEPHVSTKNFATSFLFVWLTFFVTIILTGISVALVEGWHASSESLQCFWTFEEERRKWI